MRGLYIYGPFGRVKTIARLLDSFDKIRYNSIYYARRLIQPKGHTSHRCLCTLPASHPRFHKPILCRILLNLCPHFK
ncbi:L-pipecolate oxidase [Fusarium oxysporum f. sp. albedinis]|nr:L-pipecolate oxidase [Fusarium oxysporum f. sp. albedinis]